MEIITNKEGKFYYSNNKRHRLDGPAVERADGTKEWYQNGKLHRVDGPAIEYADGNKFWYQQGLRHRTDGPAVVKSSGKFWHQNGYLHRIDGPAVEWANGTKEWWDNGKYIKSCFPKTITIQEDGVEKQASICCIECVRSYKHISEEKFYKLSLLL